MSPLGSSLPTVLSAFVIAADEPSALPPVLGLVGVALTAAVTVLTTWRWPTLRRRIQEHVALVKDLPAGSGEPIRALLEDEIEILAQMDGRRLDMLSRVLSWVARASLMVICLPFGALFVALVLELPVDQVSDRWTSVTGNILTAAFVLAMVSSTWLVARQFDWWGRFRGRFLP